MTGFDRVRRAAGAVAVALALAAGLGGCGKIATDDSVEEQVRSQLGTDTADCPQDLDGEVGKSIVCTATDGDATFDVRVTVTSVEGDTINFDIERVGGPPAATAEPAPGVAADDATADSSGREVDGDDVAQSVFDQLTATVGTEPDGVSCPDLPAEVGASQRCTLTTGTDTYGVTVTVTGVEGTDVRFDIQVDQTPQ